MAFPTTSFIPLSTIRDILKGVIGDAGPVPVKIGGTDTLKVALYGDTSTVAETTDPIAYGGGTLTEITGTNWTVPQALTGVTLASAATGILMLDDTGNVSVANTTISTAVKGCGVYDDTPTVGTADCMLAIIYFGSGTGYTTNNGTFGITWDTNGIWRITLH